MSLLVFSAPIAIGKGEIRLQLTLEDAPAAKVIDASGQFMGNELSNNVMHVSYHLFSGRYPALLEH